jgi:phosphate starvation-inducible PhoH-like protein/PhoH-like ATPase
VPTRDLGFLPGTLKEKIKQYESPYKSVCAEIFSRGDAYDILKSKDMVEFMSTSFIRGETYDNCVLFIDEMQNLTFHELDSVITRAGENTRLIFSGDFKQSDLARNHDRHGLLDFMKILDKMKEDFSKIQFDIDDVVRSGLVKSYLLAKDKFFT